MGQTNRRISPSELKKLTPATKYIDSCEVFRPEPWASINGRIRTSIKAQYFPNGRGNGLQTVPVIEVGTVRDIRSLREERPRVFLLIAPESSAPLYFSSSGSSGHDEKLCEGGVNSSRSRVYSFMWTPAKISSNSTIKKGHQRTKRSGVPANIP